MQDIRCKKAN